MCYYSSGSYNSNPNCAYSGSSSSSYGGSINGTLKNTTFCFPLSSKIRLSNGAHMKLSELKVGDNIASWDEKTLHEIDDINLLMIDISRT